MKKYVLTALLAIILSLNISAVVKLETTKELVLQAGYGEVLSVNIATMTSQGVSDLVGMPFNIFDPYVQYNANADNPAYGERVIARWSILANSNFSLSIEATPLMHVTMPESQERPLYYRLAHEFTISYTSTTGDATDIKGFFVFVPDENATDGSGTTRVYVNNGYRADTNGNGKIEFTEIVSDYWALQGTYIGAVEENIYFGFTQNTSNYLNSNQWTNATLPDGIYESTVTIRLEAI